MPGDSKAQQGDSARGAGDSASCMGRREVRGLVCTAKHPAVSPCRALQECITVISQGQAPTASKLLQVRLDRCCGSPRMNLARVPSDTFKQP
jgi:hypothetical protein